MKHIFRIYFNYIHFQIGTILLENRDKLCQSTDSKHLERKTNHIRAMFSSRVKIFRTNITFLFVYGNYCPIITRLKKFVS